MAPLPSWCPPYSSLKIDPVTQQEVYCICKQPDDGRLMVGCDGCDDWFHFSCMKIPEEYRDLVYSFYCPYCQAGITGKKVEAAGKDGTVALPKTLWKRKCRLKSCYKPCKEGSKYCSEEHGMEYIRDALGRLQHGVAVGDSPHGGKKIKDPRSDLRDMLIHSGGSIEKFKVLGSPEFIFEDVPVPPSKLSEPEIYGDVIANDSGLSELQRSLEECDNVTRPQLKQDMERFQTYIDWIDEINNRLNGEGDGDTKDMKNPSDTTVAKGKLVRKKKGKKSGGVSIRSKKKNSICGYTADVSTIPCLVDEFLEGYKNLRDSEETQLHGVCIKTRCNRHSEWVSIRSEQLEQRQMSLESYIERLRLLIRTRKQQLHIQYYEKLTELQRKEEEKLQQD